MSQIIFIDDSGDPGFKVGKGSSGSLVMALVIFDDELDAEDAAVKIKKLRRELDVKDAFEFKFNKCRDEYRTRFLERVANCNFRVRAIVMDKERIYSVKFRSSKETFYNYTIKTVLKNHAGTIANAKLRLDGRGSRELRQQLRAYLSWELGPGIIKDVKFRDSKRDVLCQLADMVAGAIRLAHDDPRREGYREIIEARLEDVWKFGWQKIRPSPYPGEIQERAPQVTVRELGLCICIIAINQAFVNSFFVRAGKRIYSKRFSTPLPHMFRDMTRHMTRDLVY